MWQYLVKAAIGSIIMKSKPIKKMVKRFMRGAVKKLGKTAGTLIGGAALMIMGGYATNGAYGFAKGFFGGAGAASQAKSVFDLVGRAKDAFSTAGSEMTSFTEFLKGGVDKAPVVETADVSTDPTVGFTDAALRGDITTGEGITAETYGMPEAFKPQTDLLADLKVQQRLDAGTQDFTLSPGSFEEQIQNQKIQLSDLTVETPEARPWYSAVQDQVKKGERWAKDNPKTATALQTGLGLLANQGPPPTPQEDPMMTMGVGGYTGYGTSQTDAWRAYAPEYVAYSVDNQLNPNSYVNYMSALG